MPSSDLTMCKDSNCPLRLNCFRYIGRPSEKQSYQKWNRIGMACVGYMPVKEDEDA